MKRTLVTIAFFAVLATPVGALSASPKSGPNKVKVSVDLSGSDLVATQFAYHVREELRRSAKYTEASYKAATLHINLVSVDPDENTGDTGIRTAVSVCVTIKNFNGYQEGNPQTWYPIFLDQSVVIVGDGSTEPMAQSVVASLDTAVSKYVEQLKDVAETRHDGSAPPSLPLVAQAP